MKGTVPKRLDICLDFGTTRNILNFYFLLAFIYSCLFAVFQRWWTRRLNVSYHELHIYTLVAFCVCTKTFEKLRAFYNDLKNRLYCIPWLKCQSDNHCTCCEKIEVVFFNCYEEFQIVTRVSYSFLGSIYQPLFGKRARAPPEKESRQGLRESGENRAQFLSGSLLPFGAFNVGRSFILLIFIILRSFPLASVVPFSKHALYNEFCCALTKLPV